MTHCIQLPQQRKSKIESQQNAVHDQQSVSHRWRQSLSQQVKTGQPQFDIC